MRNDLIKTLPGPENTLKREFPNGVTVLIQENPGSSTAAICGSLFAGSCLEDSDQYGLSAFVSAARIASMAAYCERVGGHMMANWCTFIICLMTLAGPVA